MSKKSTDKYKNNSSMDALLETFKPEEAKRIKEYIEKYTEVRGLIPPEFILRYSIDKEKLLEIPVDVKIKSENKPKPFKKVIRSVPCTLPFVGTKTKNIDKLIEAQETSMPLLQAMLIEWYSTLRQKELSDEDIPGILLHLKEEVEELINEPKNIEEYADVLILTLQALFLAGYSVEDWIKAGWKKHYKNLNRKWLPPDEDGVVRHRRED